MFRDQPVTFPDDNPVLGRYLGPAIDVGPTLTAKILKTYGEVVYWSTYRVLTDGEGTNASHVSRHIEFDHNIQVKLGPKHPRMIFRILTSPKILSTTTSMMSIMPVGMTNG